MPGSKKPTTSVYSKVEGEEWDFVTTTGIAKVQIAGIQAGIITSLPSSGGVIQYEEGTTSSTFTGMMCLAEYETSQEARPLQVDNANHLKVAVQGVPDFKLVGSTSLWIGPRIGVNIMGGSTNQDVRLAAISSLATALPVSVTNANLTVHGNVTVSGSVAVSGSTLSAIQTALQIIDDWDSSDRANVNIQAAAVTSLGYLDKTWDWDHDNVTGTGTKTIIASAGSGKYNYLKQIKIINNDDANLKLRLIESGGSVLYGTILLPAYGGQWELFGSGKGIKQLNASNAVEITHVAGATPDYTWFVEYVTGA